MFVFVLCTRKLLYRLAGVAITVAVTLYAIDKQERAVEQDTGTRVFSGFSGWQLANNVLYYYKKIEVDKQDMYSPELQTIDKVINSYIDSVDRVDSVGCVYMWDKKSPLKVVAYMRMQSAKERYFLSWMFVSVYFKEYAWIIIRQHPWAYFRYFMMPNAKEYFYPTTEVLRAYNISEMKLDSITTKWYGLKTATLSCKAPGVQKHIMMLYPFITLLLHLGSMIAIFFFLVKAIKFRRTIGKDKVAMFLAWCLFYFGYTGFSIVAAPVYMRLIDPLYVLCLIMPATMLCYRPGRMGNVAVSATSGDTRPAADIEKMV